MVHENNPYLSGFLLEGERGRKVEREEKRGLIVCIRYSHLFFSFKDTTPKNPTGS